MVVPHSLRLSVLVVEDNADAADSLADVLRLHGHRVAVARSAAQALDVAGREPPDVALLDIGLPDLDGWQVARWLRAGAEARGGKRPLLVAVTAYGDTEDRERSRAIGLDLHLVKPVDPAALAGVLARFRRMIAEPIDGPPAADCVGV